MRTSVMLFAFIAFLQPAHAQDVYSVEGQAKGFFCRYFGFVCSFKQIDALKVSNEDIRALPRSYETVSDYKPSADDQPGKCWIRTRADQSLGWWAYLADWWSDAPTFYALKDNGTYDELGSPDFIVFPCRKYS